MAAPVVGTSLQDAVGGGLVVAEFLDDQVTVSKVNGPLIPVEAHTGGDTVTPVARGHVVAGAILHRAGFENIAAAQGQPIERLVFRADVEAPRVAPVFGAVRGAVLGIVHMDIQGAVVAPYGIEWCREGSGCRADPSWAD